MKKVFLSLIASGLLFFNSMGQCTPDTSITHNQVGIYPDSATGLPHAYVGSTYSTVIQMKVLVDSNTIAGYATVDSVIITGVSGLPTGFNYYCTPSTCHFPGGSDACIQLEGAAPTTPMIGTYPIVVNVTAYGHLSGFPVSLPTNISRYSIVIEQSVGITSLSYAKFEVSQNIPNPFNRSSDISFISPTTDIVMLKISNLLGKTVYTKSLHAQKGMNKISLSSSDFDPGIYIYTISSGSNSITRRMIVSNDR